jgi:pimeloyl-ACP methyl ester carboxylesterase
MITTLCGLIRGGRSQPTAFTPTYGSFSGVGFTTPLVQVFNSSEETFSWDVKDKTNQLFSEDPSALARGYARWSVFGDLALQRTQMSAEHASTAMVARDMLSITRAFGFDKLNYWGFSYGTVIGATFAAMFPNNVGRLVLEYVCAHLLSIYLILC